MVTLDEAGAMTRAMTGAVAGAMTGISQLTPPDSAQPRAWHFAEGPNATVLVCLESLLKSL
jgi:hypothetical protein